jgi:hypothetical protein
VGETVRRGVSLCASGAPRGCERRLQAPPAASCARVRLRAPPRDPRVLLAGALEHSRAL